MTETFASPISQASAGCSAPRTVPGGMTSKNMPVGISSASSSPYAQVRACGSKHWVVVASVNSHALTPVSQ